MLRLATHSRLAILLPHLLTVFMFALAGHFVSTTPPGLL